MTLVDRGDVFDADLPNLGMRPVVVVTRQEAIPYLSSVAVVLITSTVRGHGAEVPLGAPQGFEHECVANCDSVLTLPKCRLVRRRGALRVEDQSRLDDALRLALGLD